MTLSEQQTPTKAKYYIRVSGDNVSLMEDHFDRCGIAYSVLNSDFGYGRLTYLYSVNLTSEQVLALKLSVPLIGCMDFHRTLTNLTTKL